MRDEERSFKVRELLNDIKPYQPGKRVSEVREELGLEELIKLSSNESPLPPTKLAQRAMRLAVSQLNRYPDGGSRLLTAKLSKRLKAPPENIIIGNGSNELIRLLVQITTEPGDELVMAEPSFIVYPLVAKIMQARAVQVPLVDNRHDLEAMAAAVTPKTRVVFVCNPNNPSGTIVTGAEIREFINKVPPDVIIAFDEAYYEYVDDPEFMSGRELFAAHPNIVVFHTFSKIYGLAGIRIGYALAPATIVEAIQKVREPFNVNMLAQVGAYFSLDSQAEIAARKAFNRREKEYLQGELRRLNLPFAPSQTNFIYVDLGKDALEAFRELQQLGVIVRAFPDSSYVRITIGTSRENRKLVQILERYRQNNAN